MPKIIKGDAIVEDEWRVVEEPGEEFDPGDQRVILPLRDWLALEEQTRLGGGTAPWIESDEEFEEYLDDLLKAPMIALNFPTFMDGRAFSSAETLRRQGYQGELRAIGYLIQDQLFYLKRCGFDSICLREGTDLEAAVKTLNHFSVVYQTSADTEAPLFRRR